MLRVYIYALHREGNLRAYRELLEREEESFVEAGIFLLLEQLRALVLRNLFKRVYVHYITNLRHLSS